jgi:endonuclease YncB( thermonuclease family)
MGLLVVTGKLRVRQFWPKGSADADTATVEVVLSSKKSFIHVSTAGTRRATRAFRNAEVIGIHGRQRVIKHDKKLNADKISVRLQAIDAPELHYQPQGTSSAGNSHGFRQRLGETCANALLSYLSKFGKDDLRCEVVTEVGTPGDVCDVYGRVVGNLVIVEGGARIDINHWLIREGWALPGLYNSMSKTETRQVLADHEAARQGKRGVFRAKYVSASLVGFDSSQRYRPGPPHFSPFSDKGRFNFPKFFRRQAEHHFRRAIGEPVPTGLAAYIATKKNDIAIDTKRFLKHNGSTASPAFKKQFGKLASFIKAGKYPGGREVVFWEEPARLVKAGTNKSISSW